MRRPGEPPNWVVVAFPGILCSAIGWVLYSGFRSAQVKRFRPVQTLLETGWQVVSVGTARPRRDERRIALAFRLTAFLTTALGWPLVWLDGGLDGNAFLPEWLGFLFRLGVVVATAISIGTVFGWLAHSLD